MSSNPKSCKIKNINARWIIDSRGYPTVESVVTLESGDVGIASVPSGASVGKYEAHELRDNKDEFRGKGCSLAVNNVNNVIAPKLIGEDASDLQKIDSIMIALDGTRNKSLLGANAILSVSCAAAKAVSKFYGVSQYEYLYGGKPSYVPRPMMNIINGGAHAGNNIDIQEFMIIPLIGENCEDWIRVCCEVYHCLKELLRSKGLSTTVGDEGGFAPDLSCAEDGLECMISATRMAGYEEGKSVAFALDIASGEWYDTRDRLYHLPKSGAVYDSLMLADYLNDLVKSYPIISIEDGMADEDHTGWQNLGRVIGKERGVMLVGDDLFVSNQERLKFGIESSLGNAILLKPNQIGSLSELKACAELAKKAGYKRIISHRSGDTTDPFIADLGVGLGCEYIKSGAPCRGERVAKYNRLMNIWREIKK